MIVLDITSDFVWVAASEIKVGIVAVLSSSCCCESCRQTVDSNWVGDGDATLIFLWYFYCSLASAIALLVVAGLQRQQQQ